MSLRENGDGGNHFGPVGASDEVTGRIEVRLGAEQLAALDGWRAANGIDDRSEAVRELVRLGLLSEIAKVYQFVSRMRGGEEDGYDS